MKTQYKQSLISGRVRLSFMAAGAVVLVGLLASMFFWLGKPAGSPLPVEAYYEAPRSFAGNVYRFDVRIEAQRDYRADSGRLLQVRMLQGNAPLMLFCPESVRDFMPHPGQVYRVSAAVDGDGLLLLTAFSKL